MEKSEKERPVFPGRKTRHRNFFDERGVSPVIAVILMVAITVVLAGVLYVLVSIWLDIDEPAPTGAMRFDETDPDNGVYIGSLISISRDVKLEDLSMTITDISTGKSASMNPIADGAIASCGQGELNLTYQDVNYNGELDPGDIFMVYNGNQNDRLVLSYTGGTSGQVCEVKLP